MIKKVFILRKGRNVCSFLEKTFLSFPAINLVSLLMVELCCETCFTGYFVTTSIAVKICEIILKLRHYKRCNFGDDFRLLLSFCCYYDNYV